MLIRAQLRRDLLKVLEPLKGEGLEVRPIEPGSLEPANGVQVSTLNISQFAEAIPKLGECCVISQTIEIQLIIIALFPNDKRADPCEGIEDDLDGVERQLWPFIGIYKQFLKNEYGLEVVVGGDGVQIPSQENVKRPFVQRSISLVTTYKYLTDTPDKIYR